MRIQTIYKTSAETFNGYTVEAGAYSITVTPLKQKQPGWQTAEPITIGGVSSKAGVHIGMDSLDWMDTV